ncbi:antibiotic biosynthesis monooxygenase [Hyphobacterium sp. HN65]|uniref:Antibiotic biosynthesis monooxygenase n=1 Tax=Hyphobacterium lacteum TaxID=3116575 RepID=A0ABU7LR22_9PROT|nr:antibiotic biosynthesis monooxygenase [Hyphobacterium sp. HN65]MEE2526370.1 antibiotic biosynthesis monooxygenase [Hyphobacterium sp. HN65]
MQPHGVVTPEPPYIAVIFTFRLDRKNLAEYEALLKEINAISADQDGFLGEEGLRLEDGRGLTISYWRNMEAVASWQRHAAHILAKKAGREKFYLSYSLRISEVTRESVFER